MATYIRLDGVPTWYDEHGQGEPPVLLHPGGADVRAFAPNLDALAAHFRVLTPDRRGHGHSPDVVGPITYEPMAQDTIAFLEAVVGGSAHLAGSSHRVPVALLVALGRPDLARRLVLVTGVFHGAVPRPPRRRAGGRARHLRRLGRGGRAPRSSRAIPATRTTGPRSSRRWPHQEVDPIAPKEQHRSGRVGWLRAAVLGAEDGIVSTASLLIGVAAAAASRSTILLAGLAGLVAGAMSMAVGEYVSVSSQRDAERADITRERQQQQADPDGELAELTGIYVRRGLGLGLAETVAARLMQADPLGAHLRDELGMNQQTRARPVQAALVSAASIAAGAALPLLALLLTSPAGRVAAVAASALGGRTGGPGRRLGNGGYRPDRAAGRCWRPVGHRGEVSGMR